MSIRSILRIQNINRIFPGVKALDNISFELEQGLIHAFLGENGAGKSTLIKIIVGALSPSSGKIVFCDTEYSNILPVEAQQMGLGVIYQEFNLIESLSVYENIFLGHEKRNGALINKKKMVDEAQDLLTTVMDSSINPTSLIRNLSVAEKQIVEITKAVSQKVKLLIMDEPSASLTQCEVDNLFLLMRRLKKQGVTIIYISHRLEEIFEIADTVSIFRDGTFIRKSKISEITKKVMIELMVGRELKNEFPVKTAVVGEKILDVQNLNRKGILKDISFSLKSGEILGLAGLVGAGRTELARAIFAADKIDSGTIRLNNIVLENKSPEKMIEHGIGLVPEDRKLQGLLLGLSVKENMSLSHIKKLSRFIFLNKKIENEEVSGFISSLSIKTPSSEQIISNLSGGNQQKVVIAKWLSTKSKVLIFDEPTRGIDVGAKYEIYLLLHELALKGLGIIMISSDMAEVIGMSDRILVMHEGQIQGELTKDEFSQTKILELAAGCRE